MLRVKIVFGFLFCGFYVATAQEKNDPSAGISLSEVVVTEDSIISLSIEKAGIQTIFNATELEGFQIDSLQQSIRWQKMGLNAYGIDTQAINLIDAIQYRLPGVQQLNPATGLVQLRAVSSINNNRTIPLFVVDGQIFEIPDQAVQDAQQRGIPLWSFYPPIPFDDIVDVKVLSSLAETVRYGLQGNAGVIVITTKNAKKRKESQRRTVGQEKNTSRSIYLENPYLTPPIFPGCEASEKKKACFKSQVQEFVQSQVQLPSDQSSKLPVRVYVQIFIDAYGNVSDYRARTEEGKEVFALETLRIVKKLPKMIPAQLGDQNVGIPFAFGIQF
ncbi:MAG: hypothetical protein ACON47_04770 [Flavobacteriaceae bacterium]